MVGFGWRVRISKLAVSHRFYGLPGFSGASLSALVGIRVLNKSLI